MPQRDASEIVSQATAAFNAGKADAARRLCEDGLRRWPNEPTLNHCLAAMLFSCGEIKQARRCIEASLAAAPRHPPARLLAARIAEADDDPDAALAHLDHPVPASAASDRLLLRARLLGRTGRRQDAEAAWRRVLEAEPGSREAMARLGRLTWEGGDPAEAVRLLEGAVAGTCPPSTWFDLGLARQDLQDHTGAAAAFREVLAGRPDDAQAAVNLGIALQESGDLDGAMSAFAMAYRLSASTFGTIAMALSAAPHGRIWLDDAALRRLLAA